MTRLRFLIVSVLAGVASMVPWRRRCTLEEWMTRNNLCLHFTHLKYGDYEGADTRSSAMLGSAEFGVAWSLGCRNIPPAEFEKCARVSLLGSTFQFFRYSAVDLAGPIDWTTVSGSNIVPFKKTLVREVHFPADLIV